MIIASCQNRSSQPDSGVSEDQTPTSIYGKTDTIILKESDFGHFLFQTIQDHDNMFDDYYGAVHLKNKDQKIYLFPTTSVMAKEEPQHLYGNYYGYPYYSGGNYSRSMGIELIKVTKDTALYLGPVCGYADIDEDGEKELYVDIVTRFGECNAENKIEKFKVELVGDSLVYPVGMERY